MEKTRKLSVIILSTLLLMLMSFALFACGKSETESVKVTFRQSGAEAVVVTIERGSPIKDLPPLENASENFLIREWNVADTFVAVKDTTIEAIEYTRGLEFEDGTNKGNTVYTVAAYTGTSSKVVIPEYYRGGQVRSIKAQVFYKNKTITEVVLPDTMKHIATYTFADARNLTKLNLPSELTNLESHVFSDTAIEGAITIPDAVTKVGLRAFWAAKFDYLDTNNAESAGEFAFGGSKCQTVVWGLSLKSVYDNTFYGQPVKEIFYEGDESDWRSIEWIDVDYSKVSASAKLGAKEKLLKEAKIYYVSDWELVDGVPTLK